MQRSRTPRRRLSLESLEDRCNPTNGVPWLDPLSLTLSFAPDGTGISGSPSNLFSLLGSSQPAAWQREILRAYQTWAIQANINIGLVGDGGQPMGTAGAPQEDPRFGDIRIGARPLSTERDDSLAGASGFEHAGGTWSGDVVLNNVFQFGVGEVADSHDLFSVMVHEAGNSLGLRDKPLDSPDKSAVMWPKYQARTGLAGADVTALQQLYGVRVGDAYEGAFGNATLSSAYDLSANGNRTAITGDVTQLGDVDVYQFTAPAATTGINSLTVQLEAAGVSLFTGKVTVFDDTGAVIGTGVTTDPLANNVSVPVDNLQPGATYFVMVEGAGADVFSAGAYNLRLSYNLPYGTSAVRSTTPYVNYEGWWGNGSQGSAQALHPISAGHLSTFAVGGLLTSSSDVDWFQVAPAVNASGTLTVSVWAWQGSSLLPAVSVYTASGSVLPSEVVANDNGMFTVQVANQTAGNTYSVRVAAADPANRATGLYVMGANLGSHAPTFYDSLTSSTLSSATSVAYSTMTVGEARLTQFSLSAATATPTEAAVRMSVFDGTGKRVFTLVAKSGQAMTSGAVWLPMGRYTVAFNAATKTGAALPEVAFTARKRERSSPIDPYIEDPTDNPTGPPPPPDGTVITSPPTPTPPQPPLGGPIDPISDPYVGF